jgi:hypothetical protein
VSHRYGDERIVEWLQEHEYHPRSPKHGSASCLFLLDDLLHESALFREAAENGEVVYQEDYTVGSGDSKWNTDLVVGPASGDVQVELDSKRPIVEQEPAEVWLAIDAKSVMTEHGKARRNRQRDINSFADIMHSHHPGSVTGGVLLINMADRFNSPLRDEDDITDHDRIETLVAETVDIFRDINRAQGNVSPNVDAVGCVVVEHTNMDDGSDTRLVTDPPAPQPGDIVHYRDFVEIITETFEDRWLRGERPTVLTITTTDERARLNQQVINTARTAHRLGDALDNDSLDEDALTEMREQVAALESVIDEIERRYLE